MKVMEPKTKLKVHVRWQLRRDMPAVLKIEAASHEHPMREDEVLEILRRRNCIGMAAECDGLVVAHMIYELHRDRVHVLDFAVDPEFRRRGVGEQMMDKLKFKLRHDRRRKLTLTVRETYLGGLLFLKKMGFKAVGVRRGEFEDSGEDGYDLEYAVESAVENQCFAEAEG